MEEKIILDRETYKKIKSMNRTEMEKTLKNLYQLGYENALKEGAIDLDTEKLRAEITARLCTAASHRCKSQSARIEI